MKYLLQYIFWFILFFGIHYAEGLTSMGTLSFAQLWKMPLIAFGILLLFKRKNKYTFEYVGIITFIEAFFCPEMSKIPLSVLLYSSKNLLVVLFFNYWMKYYGNRVNTLKTIIFSLAQFICLTSIPILLGIIEPPFQMDTTDSFGAEMRYYRAIFGSPHCASSYFCISIIILLTGFIQHSFKSKWSKIYNVVLIAVGFYSIFNTFVRTGWLMLCIAFLLLFDFSKITRKRITLYIITFFIVSGSVLYLYNNNEAFYGRITGRNIYKNTGGEGIDLQGSGRTTFWYNAINVWSRGDMYELLFGQGITTVREENLRTTGMPVFSHNQFMDQLAQYGLIGFILLILYYWNMYKYIKKCRTSPYYRMCMSLFCATIIFCIFQNEPYFIYAIIFSGVLVLTKQTTHKYNKYLR